MSTLTTRMERSGSTVPNLQILDPSLSDSCRGDAHKVGTPQKQQAVTYTVAQVGLNFSAILPQIPLIPTPPRVRDHRCDLLILSESFS